MLTAEKRKKILAEIDSFEPIIDRSVEEVIHVLKRMNEDGRKLEKIQADIQNPVKKLHEIMDNVDPKDTENAVIRERMLVIMTKINRIKKHADELEHLAI